MLICYTDHFRPEGAWEGSGYQNPERKAIWRLPHKSYGIWKRSNTQSTDTQQGGSQKNKYPKLTLLMASLPRTETGEKVQRDYWCCHVGQSGEAGEGKQRDGSKRKTRSDISGFEDKRRGPQCIECWWPLKARRATKTNSPLELQKERSPANTLILA